MENRGTINGLETAISGKLSSDDDNLPVNYVYENTDKEKKNCFTIISFHCKE